MTMLSMSYEFSLFLLLNTSPRSFPEENLSGPKAIIMGQGEGMGDVFLLLLEVSAASSPSCSSPSSLHVGRKGPTTVFTACLFLFSLCNEWLLGSWAFGFLPFVSFLLIFAVKVLATVFLSRLVYFLLCSICCFFVLLSNPVSLSILDNPDAFSDFRLIRNAFCCHSGVFMIAS